MKIVYRKEIMQNVREIVPTVGKNFETYLISQKQISFRVAKNYRYSVVRFLKWAETIRPTQTKAVEYYLYMKDRNYTNSTLANIIFALNHYFRFLGKKLRLKPPKQHKREPVFLTVEEARSLVRVIPNIRDRAIVLTLLHTGMRVSELCNLNICDLHLDSREIMVRDTKSFCDRKVIISESCVNALREYLAVSRDLNREPVFISQKGGRISRNRVYALVKHYGIIAGIEKPISPHVLRHTLATTMIVEGASVIEVKQQLGHRSLESTLRYVHLQTDHRKKLYDEHCPDF